MLHFILTAIALSTFSSHALNVVIDPGHGGSDVGAHRDGFHESKLTLKVSKLLFERLQSDSTIEAHLTRSEDINLDLESRVEIVEKLNADLVLSIHANSSPDHRAHGVEFYFQNQLNADETSEFLSHHGQSKLTAKKSSPLLNPAWPDPLKTIFTDLLDQARVKRSFYLSRSLRESWRGNKKAKAHSLKQASFHMVSRTDVPSTLVELGFLTNSKDFSSLKDDAYLERIVDSMVSGLKEYKFNSQQL